MFFGRHIPRLVFVLFFFFVFSFFFFFCKVISGDFPGQIARNSNPWRDAFLFVFFVFFFFLIDLDLFFSVDNVVAVVVVRRRNRQAN